jgi:hypothetical protein
MMPSPLESMIFKQAFVCTEDIVPSYEIIEEGRAIKFAPCGIVSHNLNDVRHFYCASCKRYMNDDSLLRHRLGKFYERK